MRHGSSFRFGEERRSVASTVVLRRDAQNVRERFHAGKDPDAFARTRLGRPADVSDDLYARLRKQFSEEQLMQLGAQIAFENYRARWNRIFNVESDNLWMPQPNKSQESRSA